MSFIRSLSNPENLYVWDDVSGHIMFHQTGQAVGVKRDVVYNLFKKVKHKNTILWPGEQPLSNRIGKEKFSIRECLFNTQTKKVLSQKEIKNRKLYDNIEFFIEVTVNKHKFYMYLVTWQYIARNIIDHLNREKWYNKILYRIKNKWYGLLLSLNNH